MKTDFNQLMTFIKVAEAGSMTKAATLLRQPKSRVSRRIHALEKSLGVSLLVRTTRSQQLTQAGRDLFGRCQPLILALEEATESLQTHKEEVTGTLHITAPEDLGRIVLPPLLADFCRLHPKLNVQLHYTGQYLDLIKEGIDVALRIGNLKDTSLKARKLTDVYEVLVASPDYLEKNSNPTSIESLAQHACLSFAPISQRSQWELTNSKEVRKVKIQSQVTANTPDTLRELAILGRGIALLPAFLVAEDLREGRLVHILKAWRTKGSTLQIVTPPQKNAPARTRHFIDFLLQNLHL